MTRALHWSAAFVGLPWADRGRTGSGVDCWGLLRLAYASRGVSLPSYTGAYVGAEEAAEIARLMAGEAVTRPWRRVPSGREWDAVMFRVTGLPAHVGVVTAPGFMLHISARQSSCIAPFQTGRWAPRFAGFYRHEAFDD